MVIGTYLERIVAFRGRPGDPGAREKERCQTS
jgi:hypothetical protein